jgi:phosphoglycerate dehydrogenase-like enzyme
MNILVTIPQGGLQEEFFPPERRERLESLGTVDWNETTEQFNPVELAERLEGVDVCVTGWGTPTFDESVVENADALELVAHVGGSVRSIGSHALYDAGVSVCSANAVMAEFVAEGILGYILAGLRDIPGHDATIKSGGWERDDVSPGSLFGATVGFVGLGAVGRTLLELLDPFDVEVLLYDPYVSADELAAYDAVELTDLETTLRSSRVVSIHAPKTEETIGMLDADRLGQLSDGALLVNAARGEIIDQDDLVAELETGRFSAVLDVYRTEPLPVESRLRDLENAILQPHVAGHPSRYHIPDTILDEVARFAGGEPLEHAIPRRRFEGMTNDQLTVDQD